MLLSSPPITYSIQLSGQELSSVPLRQYLAAELRFLGLKIDPHALEKARYNGLSDDDLRQVEIKDFVLNPPTGPFKSIVANPPYIRHHRLSNDLKNELRRISAETVGTVLGRARRPAHLFSDTCIEPIRQ